MTCIVAVKNKHGWLFGSDSYASYGNYGRCETSQKVGKLIKYQYDNKLTIADCGSSSKMSFINSTKGLTDYFLHKEEIDQKEGRELYQDFNIKYVIKEVVPKIYANIESMHLENELDDGVLDGSFMIAYGEKAFAIQSTGHVIEIADFYAMGSGSSGAIGYYLLRNENEDPLLTILKCLQCGIRCSEYCKFPIRITSSNGDDIQIIDEFMAKQMIEIEEKEANECLRNKEEQ